MIAEEKEAYFPNTPGRRVTQAAVEYIERVKEFRDFNEYYHSTIKYIVETNPFGVTERNIYQKYRTFLQYFTEQFVCRSHDHIAMYLESIFFDLLLENFNNISQDDIEKYSTIYEKITPVTSRHHSEEGRRYFVCEKIAERYQGARINELAVEIKKRFKFDVFPDSEEKEYCLAISALRNVIVHNDRSPNTRFVKRTAGIKYKVRYGLGGRIQLDEKFLVGKRYFLDRIVFRLDWAVVDAGLLPGIEISGRFYIRGTLD